MFKVNNKNTRITSMTWGRVWVMKFRLGHEIFRTCYIDALLNLFGNVWWIKLPYPSFYFISDLKLTVYFKISHFFGFWWNWTRFFTKGCYLSSASGALFAEFFFSGRSNHPKVGNLIKTTENVLKNVSRLFSSEDTKKSTTIYGELLYLGHVWV